MEEFYIDCDGIKLHAKLDKPDGFTKGPLMLLVHGFTGHMEEDHIIASKDALIESGLAVLRVEMYGHGKSGGEFRKHTLYKWVTSALAAVDYAKTLDFVTDLYIGGHSQGGLLTMLIAGMRPDDFKAILPLSPAWMIPDGAREGNLLGIDFDPLHIPEYITGWCGELDGDYIRTAQTIHVEEEIERYTGPVYIIHGDADDTVPYYYGVKAQELYKDAKLIGIKDADHCFCNHLGELKDAIKSITF
ncbi:MAG: S9 family peptidase [Saccharofermentans sp.]|nr:S9 family peptidase [Saccharofermentans sp.]